MDVSFHDELCLMLQLAAEEGAQHDQVLSLSRPLSRSLARSLSLSLSCARALCLSIHDDLCLSLQLAAEEDKDAAPAAVDKALNLLP
jgi:hypothetical protein